MKILVTGGAGFIGSAVVRRGIHEGHTIKNIDKLTYAACIENLKSVCDNPNYSFEKIDICNGSKLINCFNKFMPDAVMHLAAESHVDRSIDTPSVFVQSNIVGTYEILEASKKYWEHQGKPKSFRFHHISTDEVYGSLGLEEDSFTEESNLSPSSPYSASKSSSDLLVEAWGKTYGIKYLITNCSNNFGPRQYHEKLIPKVILNCINSIQIPVYGSGSNVRDWLYVDDHVDAILSLYHKSLFQNTRFNIGGGYEASNLEVVNIILDILDSKYGYHKSKDLISYVDDRKGHDLRYSIDNSKIKNFTGWSPQSDFKERINQTIEWYLENKNWWES